MAGQPSLVWKAATWLVIEHGEQAQTLVDDLLLNLEGAHADEWVMILWRQIGGAVGELLEAAAAKSAKRLPSATKRWCRHRTAPASQRR